MKLTVQHVRHVANLARLELTPDEEVRFTSQLSHILEAMEQLAELDTAQVPPTSSVADVAPPSRPDEAGGMLSTDEALGNAPRRVGTSFAIPRVLE